MLAATRSLIERGAELDNEEMSAISVDPALAVEKITARPVVDWFVVWEPQKGFPVDYTNVERFVTDYLIPSFPNIRAFVSDRYQSESLKSKVADRGIEYFSLLFSQTQALRGYYILRRYVWNNLTRYVNDPVLIMEAEQLLKIAAGKVTHPDGGHDDRVAVLMLCVTKLIELLSGEAAQSSEQDLAGLQIRFTQYVNKFASEKKRPPTANEAQRDMKIPLELAMMLLEDVSVEQDETPMQSLHRTLGIVAGSEDDL